VRFGDCRPVTEGIPELPGVSRHFGSDSGRISIGVR
jgi:putative component of toxin-antitoxin plasmid stabilization module